MAATVTCRFCDATIRPPGGRVEAVTHCPWCSADLRAAPTAEPAAARKPRPPREADTLPAPPAGGVEPLVAAAILGVSAVLAVAAFFAARWLMLAVR